MTCFLPCCSPGCYFKDDNLAGKLAIITGGNAGIGFHCAKALLKKGMRVLILCRSHDKGSSAVVALNSVAHTSLDEQMIIAQQNGLKYRTRQKIPDEMALCDSAAGHRCSSVIAPHACHAAAKHCSGRHGRVSYAICDLSSLASVGAVVADISAQLEVACDVLDVLVLNAGIMACPRAESADGYELQFATNHLGHAALTIGLWKHLTAARIVSVSSVAHHGVRLPAADIGVIPEPYNAWQSYSLSKLCNVLFANELNRRLPPRASAVAVHPGVIRSGLWQHQQFLSYFLCKGASDGGNQLVSAVTGDPHPERILTPCCCCSWPAAPNEAAYSVDDAERLWLRTIEIMEEGGHFSSLGAVKATVRTRHRRHRRRFEPKAPQSLSMERVRELSHDTDDDYRPLPCCFGFGAVPCCICFC